MQQALERVPFSPSAGPRRCRRPILATMRSRSSRRTSCRNWMARCARVESGYADYRFSEIAQTLYDFVWAEFCDWFIEAAKADFGDPARKAGTLATMDYALRRILLLLHPVHAVRQRGTVAWARFWLRQHSICGMAACERGPHRNRRRQKYLRAVTMARTLRATYNLPSSKRLRWLLANRGGLGERGTRLSLVCC